MRLAALLLCLLLVWAAAPVSAQYDPVSPTEFRAAALGWSKAHVQAVWGTTGVRKKTWTEGGRAYRRKRYPTTQHFGTWVLATYRHTLPGAAHQWSLVDKEWCVSADFGPAVVCRPRPYPW